MRKKGRNFAELLVFQLLDFATQRRCRPDVLEQRWLVVQPQLRLLVLAVFLTNETSGSERAISRRRFVKLRVLTASRSQLHTFV